MAGVTEAVRHVSERDLARIVERASTVAERLGDRFEPADSDDTTLVDARLEAWCQAVAKGDWDRFRLRLAWDGLDLKTVRRALGRVRLRKGATLPEWSEFLAEALRLPSAEGQEGEDAT